MCDDDEFGSLEVYMLCVMMISLEVWKIGSLHIVCDDDKFGSLEVWRFGGLEVYTSCVMMISLEVWRFTHCV